MIVEKGRKIIGNRIIIRLRCMRGDMSIIILLRMIEIVGIGSMRMRRFRI